MTYLASERSWLINPSLLRLFHECRRQIQSEFGVRLHLTEEHLEQNLADYASRTRSAHLIRTWEALRPHIPNLESRESGGRPETAKRMYRGQEVADDGPPTIAARLKRRRKRRRKTRRERREGRRSCTAGRS